MSPRERSAWIRLASILIVFIPYFLHVIRLFEGDHPVARALCIAFVAAALAHGLLNGLAQAAVTLVAGRDVTDERDAAIDALSLRVAYYALLSLVLAGIGTFAFLGVLTRPDAAGRILQPTFPVTSQFVFLCCVLAEALRHGTRLFCYRREALA